MDFSTYMQIASNGYKMLLNAFNAYHDGNIAKSENIMLDVLSYLHDNKFFSYMTKSDFDNNEMDYDSYQPQMVCMIPQISYMQNDCLYYLDDASNDDNFTNLFDCIFDNCTFDNFNMSLHSSASFTFTIFGDCLGMYLHNKFGV